MVFENFIGKTVGNQNELAFSHRVFLLYFTDVGGSGGADFCRLKE